MSSANPVSVTIAGYVAVPQGHVRIDAANPANKTVRMYGGLVAGQIRLGTHPATLQVTFDNPIAQKTVRLRSTASGGYPHRHGCGRQGQPLGLGRRQLAGRSVVLESSRSS